MYVVATVHYALNIHWTIEIGNNWQTLNMIAVNCFLYPSSTHYSLNEGMLQAMEASTVTGVNDCSFNALLTVNVRFAFLVEIHALISLQLNLAFRCNCLVEGFGNMGSQPYSTSNLNWLPACYSW
jgi:hypothetical protein